MMLVGRRQGEELLAQLRELLYLPSPTTTTSCDGNGRRRRKRGRDDGKTNNGQQDNEAQLRRSCKTRRQTKQQQKSSRSLVTSVPDFDGYQWRKYGQKQIEGAMYARSYYRCTRSAEQGCPAKRTVQRNDAPPTTYTVVYMGDHTCTANLEEAAPVILETAVIPDHHNTSSTNKQQRSSSSFDDTTSATSAAAGSCCTTSATVGTESPAISDDITWSSSSDEYCGSRLFDDSCAPGAASLTLNEMISGPIRSPVHVPAPEDAYCWTIHHDHFLMMIDACPSS